MARWYANLVLIICLSSNYNHRARYVELCGLFHKRFPYSEITQCTYTGCFMVTYSTIQRGFTYLVLFLAANVVNADDTLRRYDFFENDCCFADIRVASLCAKKIKSACIDGDQINASKFCADLASVNDIRARAACVDALQANNLCVDNLKVNNLDECMQFKATVVYSSDTLYTLGEPLNFDVVLDDPHGDISTDFSETTYRVPRSGYYILLLQVDQNNIRAEGSLLGTPYMSPSIWVNGVKYRDDMKAYMIFADTQHVYLTTLVSLQADDIVSARYEVLSAIGLPITGTVNIRGDGTEGSGTIFKIHYLSSDCTAPLCQPCDPGVECEPCPAMAECDC